MEGKTEIWKETRGTEELKREMALEEARRQGIVMGLARCPVCEKPAKAVEFGAEGNGVWVGCDRTDECCRYIEIHLEGWSLEECAGEWNRYNRGMMRKVRKLKRWASKKFGKERRAEKERERAKKDASAMKMEQMREIFGLKEAKIERKWWNFWRNGNR